eukprot:5603360-Pyramimonas_sp.AAC.1
MNSARNLGIDYASGRRAGASTRAKRIATVLRRAARIRVLRAARGRTRQLVSLGLTPAGCWAVGVAGRAWSGIEPMRRAAHSALFVHTARRSLDVDLHLAPAPPVVG